MLYETGSPLTATVEHVVPLSRGGRTCWENEVAAHARCNSKRGSTPLDPESESIAQALIDAQGDRWRTAARASAASRLLRVSRLLKDARKTLAAFPDDPDLKRLDAALSEAQRSTAEAVAVAKGRARPQAVSRTWVDRLRPLRHLLRKLLENIPSFSLRTAAPVRKEPQSKPPRQKATGGKVQRGTDAADWVRTFGLAYSQHNAVRPPGVPGKDWRLGFFERHPKAAAHPGCPVPTQHAKAPARSAHG